MQDPLRARRDSSERRYQWDELEEAPGEAVDIRFLAEEVLAAAEADIVMGRPVVDTITEAVQAADQEQEGEAVTIPVPVLIEMDLTTDHTTTVDRRTWEVRSDHLRRSISVVE